MTRSSTPKGRRRLRHLLLVLSALMWASLASSACGTHSNSEPSAEDVAVVFCLAPTELPRLVAAATALGIARPGRTNDQIRVGGEDMSVAAWRRTNRADFDRSCAALRAASQSGPTPVSRIGGITTVLTVLLPVIVGAILAWLAAERRDATAHNQTLAAVLRASARAFLHACDDFVRKWTGTTGPARPSDQQLTEARRELAASLRQVQTLRPRWTEPRLLEEELFRHFGEDLTRDWLGQDQATRQARSQRISDQVRQLDARVDRVAHSIERSFLPDRAMFGGAGPKPSGRRDAETSS